MINNSFSRRGFINRVSATAAGVGYATRAFSQSTAAVAASQPEASTIPQSERMQWWHSAKFGMFIHWGLYSVIGQHEWAMQLEGIPIPQYELLAKHFKPKPNAARDWARVAKQAGQKYMVMTTKHHEGFCNFDTKLTNYCAPKQGPGRDLVHEYVEAAHAEGLHVGFYYSLMDWHHPDGAKCATDEGARKRFVEYTHGLIHELMSNYGKIDVLWYDVDWPLTAEQWESERMNKMVFELQPHIIVNNRNGLDGDFSTPEQHIEAAKSGRAWEACMTLNDSWGYQKSDDAWKTPKTVVKNLVTCAAGGGNYLLNIGPKPDGSVPEETVQILGAVGKWVDRNGDAVYNTERGHLEGTAFSNCSRRGNTLYINVYFWPGNTPAQQWLSFYQPPSVVAIGGLQAKVKSARLLSTGKPVTFEQDKFSVRFTGLPATAPDSPSSVIEVQCDSEPIVDSNAIRPEWPRYGVGVS